MEDGIPESENSEALAQAAISKVLASDSGAPLADAADLLIAAVLNDPEWRNVVNGWPRNELGALARMFPNGSAAAALRRITQPGDSTEPLD